MTLKVVKIRRTTTINEPNQIGASSVSSKLRDLSAGFRTVPVLFFQAISNHFVCGSSIDLFQVLEQSFHNRVRLPNASRLRILAGWFIIFHGCAAFFICYS